MVTTKAQLEQTLHEHKRKLLATQMALSEQAEENRKLKHDVLRVASELKDMHNPTCEQVDAALKDIGLDPYVSVDMDVMFTVRVHVPVQQLPEDYELLNEEGLLKELHGAVMNEWVVYSSPEDIFNFGNFRFEALIAPDDVTDVHGEYFYPVDVAKVED